MNRKPDYERGRFFVSPILGCNAQCHFCYIYDKGYTTKAVKNSFDIDQVLEYLDFHADFKLGKGGSIISIGAWGDPFPRYNKNLCFQSINWLRRLAVLGNPLQIMSRYELHKDIVEELINANQYQGHILYSTSVSSLARFRNIEPYADPPLKRLSSVKLLSDAGLATNVMIKPFIRGVTGLEAVEIASTLSKHEVKQCVVGDLLLDNRIKEKMLSTGLSITTEVEELSKQVLDCTSGEAYELNSSDEMNDFCKSLSILGIKVFKKSSCVNAFILRTPNPANYIKSDPNGYCIRCGACE